MYTVCVHTVHVHVHMTLYLISRFPVYVHVHVHCYRGTVYMYMYNVLYVHVYTCKYMYLFSSGCLLMPNKNNYLECVLLIKDSILVHCTYLGLHSCPSPCDPWWSPDGECTLTPLQETTRHCSYRDWRLKECIRKPFYMHTYTL